MNSEVEDCLHCGRKDPPTVGNIIVRVDVPREVNGCILDTDSSSAKRWPFPYARTTPLLQPSQLYQATLSLSHAPLEKQARRHLLHLSDSALPLPKGPRPQPSAGLRCDGPSEGSLPRLQPPTLHSSAADTRTLPKPLLPRPVPTH